MNVALLVPEPLDTLSGGYLYNRCVAAGLAARGHRVAPVITRGRSVGELAADPALAGADVWLEDELGCDVYLALHRELGRARPPAVSIVHAPGPLVGEQRSGEAAYLASVAAAVFPSRTTRADCERMLGAAGHCAVVAPGSDHLPVLPRCAPEHGPLRLVSVGNLIEHKGHRAVFAALSRAVAELGADAFELDLFGAAIDPDLAAHLAEAALDMGAAIRFHTSANPTGLARALAGAHAFVLGSRYESYGIAAAEAIRAGVPVVGWAVGGCAEFLRDGHNAMLVAAGGVEPLARALGALARDRAPLARLRDGARRTAGSLLGTWDRATAAIEQVLAAQVG